MPTRASKSKTCPGSIRKSSPLRTKSGGSDALKRYLLFTPFALLFAGCSLFTNNVATLWTNHPEFAAYVELFNTTQNRYRIEIGYRAVPAQSLNAGGAVPDIVIGDRLASVNVIGKLSPLDRILGNGDIDPTLFYKALLETGQHEGKQMLLPVSFNLPVVLSQKTDSKSGKKAALLSLEDILKASREFDKKSKDSFKVMGFSPLWTPEFLFATAELAGADFHQTAHGNLAWDEEKLQKSIAEMRTWVKEIDGGSQDEATFRNKYLYDPVYKLLETGRILYYYTNITKYFDLPEDKRKSIEFRWPAEQSHIPVVENILYAGIPARSHNKRAAHAFLTWLFKPETQSALLDLVRYEHLKTFGIGDGFSALTVVNERDFPRLYPVLLGRIPSTGELFYPKSLPSDWSDLKANVVLPWLEQEVLSSEPSQKLEDRLKAWRLQKPLH